MLTYNVNHEQTLINLLGLRIESARRGNFFRIIDKSKKKVGYIEILDEYTNHMEIKTDRLSYSAIHSSRENDDDLASHYHFTVQNEFGVSYIVDLNIGLKPFVCIKDQDGNTKANFSLDNSLMYLTFFEDTRYFLCGRELEVLLDNPEASFDNLGFLHKGKMFTYETTYDTLTSHPKNIKRSRLMVYRNPNSYCESELITEKSVFSGEREVAYVKKPYETPATIADLLSQSEEIKRLFTDFRLFLNTFIPFESDVLLTVLQNRGLPEYPFNVLLNELKHPVNLSHYHSVKDISDDIKLGLNSEIGPSLDMLTHCDIIYSDGTIYDFGIATTFDLNKTCVQGGLGIYQDYLLKYLNATTLSLAFDLKSRTFITGSEELRFLETEIKKHTSHNKTKIKINEPTTNK